MNTANTFTVGEVAVMLGLSPSTIRNYTDEEQLQPHLSNVATRTGNFEGSKERRYTMYDVEVLNTVKIHKKGTTTWEEVGQLLESGHRETDLPETAALVMPETRADAFQLVIKARQQIVTLTEQNEALEAKLASKDDQHRNDIERLKDEQSDLRETIGQLKFILKMHGIDPDTGQKKEK